jgi:hypothetical protein
VTTELDNATQSQLRENQSRHLYSLPEPMVPTAPILVQEDTDHSSQIHSSERSNVDVVVISDDNETGDDDDSGTAAIKSPTANVPNENGSHPAADDSNASFPNIEELLGRLDGRLSESHPVSYRQNLELLMRSQTV